MNEQERDREIEIAILNHMDPEIRYGHGDEDEEDWEDEEEWEDF